MRMSAPACGALVYMMHRSRRTRGGAGRPYESVEYLNVDDAGTPPAFKDG